MLYLAYKELLMKCLQWVGGSKKDLMKLPEDVQREIGYALYVAQKSETHESAKLFKGHGSGIYEIVSDYDKNAYRAIYIVNLNEFIYVIHVFQKKSKKGIQTPREELKVIKQRLKRLKETLSERRQI